jgi:type VI secretion system protein ImpH
MVSPRRTSNSSLIGRLTTEPWKFRFFQAVRLLERRNGRQAHERRLNGTAAVGEEVDPRQRIVRFRAATRLSFPACEIDAVVEEPSEPAAMTITFLGLSGPSSVLPQHYGVTVWRQLRNHNTALRDFFDLFNDRLVAFFYRAWVKYRVPISVERNAADGQDGATQALRALIGFGTDNLSERTEIAEHSLLHYSGLLSHFPRNAVGLAALLSDYFRLPIRVEPFDGRWVSLPREERTRMAAGGREDGCFARLSVDAVVGDSYWDVQSSFTIEVGPLDYAAFSTFMPNGSQLRRMADLTRLYVNPDFCFRVELCLMRNEVPRIELSRTTAVEPLLGWNTWLRHDPLIEDTRDASYRL